MRGHDADASRFHGEYWTGACKVGYLPASPVILETVRITSEVWLRKLKVDVDVVGLGLNATDTVLVVRQYPPLGGKERVLSALRQAGGQMATALVTCQRLGRRSRYIGKVGGNEDGQFQLESLRKEGLDLQYT